MVKKMKDRLLMLKEFIDKNGKVTPVTGINPTTTNKFNNVCKTNSKIKNSKMSKIISAINKGFTFKVDSTII